MALDPGSLLLAEMEPGTIYQVSYTNSEGRALTVVAEFAGSQTSLSYLSGTMAIDQSAITNVVASAGPVTDPA